VQQSASNHLLVADPDPASRAQISDFLNQDGHRVTEAGDGPSALDLLNRHVFQLVIADLDLPGVDGLEVIGRVQDNSPSTPIIVTSQSGLVDQAVEAMRRGAFDYQEKPVNLDHLRLTVDRALEKASLHHAFHYLRHEQPYLYDLESITAQSPAMVRLLQQVARIAPTSTTVLLTGETGTGKSLLAGAIHANSPRRDATLVTVNCAALSETLLESELFGHEKGSFTGAHKTRDGRFQQAHGGTLFLDEVGEMSPGLQAKLLRAIEDQVIYRLGGSREIHVDVRILAATNRDLSQAVEEGRFRKDLYYRLNVAPLHIPALRERREDILPLAERFLAQICAELGRPPIELSEEALLALATYPWPGNIRELKNVIERAALFLEGWIVRPGDLGLPATEEDVDQNNSTKEGQPEVCLVSRTLNLFALERQAVEAALRRTNWVQKEAARLLGITERQMTYRLNKLGVIHPNFRTKARRA
jgi:DNA-binding NtrC family response regulator